MMKCLVPVKQVIDPYVNIRVKQDGSGVEKEHVKMAMNPFDEIAMEEAVRLKEKGLIEEVVAVSIGPQQAKEVLRQALARGADKAIWVDCEFDIQPLFVAKILQHFINQAKTDLVLMGKQAIDDDNNQTGQMLAGIMGWPQGTFVSKVSVGELDKSVTVTREIDGGLESIRLKLPAVLTTDLRLNEPRYISLPNVMKAKKKPIEEVKLDALDIDLAERVKVLEVIPPPSKKAGIKVDSVAELISKLKDDEKVLP